MDGDLPSQINDPETMHPHGVFKRILGDIDHHENADWVSRYLDVSDVKPHNAPNSAAWSLLQWARTDTKTRGEFYRLFATRYLPKENPDAAGKGGESPTEKMIQKVMDSARKKATG